MTKARVLKEGEGIVTRYHDFGAEYESGLQALRILHGAQCSGVFIFYSIDDRCSFLLVPYYVRQVLNRFDVPWFPMVLVGTKKDVQDRQVSTHEGELLAHSLDCPFLEIDCHDVLACEAVELAMDDVLYTLFTDSSAAFRRKECAVM